MGIYDFVLVEPELDLPKYEGDKDPHEVSWQTRSFNDRMFRLHLITDDGYLYRAKQRHQKNGLVVGHERTGSFGYIDDYLGRDEYNGYPREYDYCDWYKIRFVGKLRITSQDNEMMYDVHFDGTDLQQIELAEPRVPHVGDTVYDKSNSPLEIVEVTDTPADEYVAYEKVTERGREIYDEKTVAEINPEYSADDRVVVVENSRGREIPMPWSRLTKNADLSYSTSH